MVLFESASEALRESNMHPRQVRRNLTSVSCCAPEDCLVLGQRNLLLAATPLWCNPTLLDVLCPSQV